MLQPDTQLYAGSDGDAQAPEEGPQGPRTPPDGKDACASTTGTDSFWTVDEVVVAGSSEAVGQCTLFPRLETLDGRIILQPGDSFRHGKSVPIFLGAIRNGKNIKLLCVSSRNGSSAKTNPLHWYDKVSSGEPSPHCQAALSRWIQSKSTSQ